MRNKRRGISIISLVITIIIILILTGAVIHSAVGENGIIHQAIRAKEEHEISVAKEKLQLIMSEYEMKMRKETLYSILSKSEYIQSISPDNEQAGLPYTVIVDGYEFLITENLEVQYQGKANGRVPDIISVNKEKISEEEIKITIKAKTKDTEGLKEVRLIKDEVEIETKEISGKEVTEEFSVRENGTYKIKVIGNNNRHKVSEEIKVTEIVTMSGSLRAGSVIDGEVVLTITGETSEESIEKIEVYEGSTKVDEIICEENLQKVEKEKVVVLPFYEEKTYYAKIVGKAGSKDTNSVKVKNTNTIKTEQDLKKMATLVNSGDNDFSGKTIKQKDNITLVNTHTAIGTESNPFKGTYDGQNKTINNLKINNTSNFQGLFGYIETSTLKNIILGTGLVKGGNRVGGAVGYAKDSIIQNVNNQGTTVNASTTYNESGNYVDRYGTNLASWSANDVCSTGGICGKTENTLIQGCTNSPDINISGVYIGGIVGYAKSSEETKIIKCINTGSISNVVIAGGIVGISNGNISIEECENTADLTGESFIGGIVGYEIGGSIKNCKNNNSASITGTYNVGGIIGHSKAMNTSSYVTVENSSNSGNVTSSSYVASTACDSGNSFSYNSNATGGIIGSSVKTNVTQCYNEGIVTSNAGGCGTGGIVGDFCNGTITKCCNKKEITGKTSVGGIVGIGMYNVKINNSCNLKNITGTVQFIGGIVGYGIQLNARYCYNVGEVKGRKNCWRNCRTIETIL